MVNELPMVELGEVASVRSGFAFRSEDMGDWGAPIIKIKNIVPPIVDIQDIQRVPREIVENDPRIQHFTLHKGDILIAMTGATVGKVGRMPKTNETYYLNQRVGKVFLTAPDKADYDFIYYALSQDIHVRQMFGIADGSAQANISGNQIESLEIPLPSLLEQRAIAAILGVLDDKIELNRQMNKTLEAMAQALFKSWFVDFEPFRDKGMEESKLGLIPKGWGVGVLEDVIDSIESGSRPRGGVKEIVEGIPSIGAEHILGLGRYNYSKTKLVPIDFFENMRDGIVHRGDVLLYKDGAQVGRKSYFDDGFPFDECCINEHVFIIRTNGLVTQKYLYFWLDQLRMTEEIINLNSNSAQPGINRTSVATLTILIPPVQVVKSFDKVVSPLTKRIFVNAKESLTLATIRDSLLPKLLSDKIRVKDAEKFVERAV